MSAKYFALLTNIGVAKIANAAALGIKLNITELAVGDGSGTLPTPTSDQTALVNERRRAPINQLSIDPLNDAQIIVEQVIPENVGGWWIKEVGLYDEDGDLVAVSNCPETYKPLLQEGSGRTQIVRMVIIVSNTSSVTVKIDPAVVLATREYVDQVRKDFAGPDGRKGIGAGETTLDKLLHVDPRMFGAHPITEPGYETFDSTQSFQQAIDYAKESGVNVVKFSGKYNIVGVSGYFKTPGDDGTAYPGWIGSGDSNIAPEVRYDLPVSLIIPDRVALVADNVESDELIGDWTLELSPINVHQKAMILITNSGGNNSICRPIKRNFRISKAFIGIVSEGIVY
ncbi:MAG: phage tail protein, partial [Chania sp.]